MENLITQWVDCDARFSGGDKPPTLHLVFAKDMEIIQTIHCDSPPRKSDQVFMQFHLNNGHVILDQNYKVKRFKYSKAHLERLRKHSAATDWKDS